MNAVTDPLSGFGRAGLAAFAVILTLCMGQQSHASTIRQDVELLLGGNRATHDKILKKFRSRGKTDVVAALIQIKRLTRTPPLYDRVLSELTGVDEVMDWNGWMLWQEANPQIKPFEDFDVFKANLYRPIDPGFDAFLYAGVPHAIRLEEITWGGVVKDGIPALTNPNFTSAKGSEYITEDELVFGVSINGDVRAYPLRMMDWHEMFNDVIGGVPVSLAYCTLCGSGILFETALPGRKQPFVFGSSGFLYRSNKLMYDQETQSLWNQFTGKPVVGKLVGSGIELKTRPVVITSWKNWLATHPETKVLSLDTGFSRDYTPGQPYSQYFNSPDLMFPALVRRDELKAKDYVFALRSSGVDKAWPVSRFEGGQVINDTAGVLDLVLIGDAATRTVRAYRADGRTFKKGETLTTLLDQADRVWTVTEDALIGPDNRQLTRLPGHVAYWFAWAGYLGKDGEFGG